MFINSKKLIIAILCSFQFVSYTQEANHFRYNGSGSRSKGTFDVFYYVESNGRTNKLDENDIQIDLNKYKDTAYFIIEFSNLKLGLNRSFNKIKNKDHSKVFYVEFTDATANDGFAPILGSGKANIDAVGGHYANEKGQLKYEIKPIDFKKVKAFTFKIKTINGVHDLQWPGPTLTKRVVFLPKAVKPKKLLHITHNNIKDSIRKENRKATSLYRNNKSTYTEEKKEKTTEDKLWIKIQNDLLNNKPKDIYKKCVLYLQSCELQLFENCSYKENALYLMALNAEKPNRKSHIKEYIEKYPEGRFMANIKKIMEKPKKKVILPINPDLAKLEFDKKALVVNRVEGGTKPYFVAFFDYKTNKEHSIISHRFYSDNCIMDLNALDITKGTYYVKVIDSENKVFVEARDVYVDKSFALPKSLKLGFVVFPLLILSFLYKKYIHF